MTCRYRRSDALSGQHTALHRGVTALDARHVDESSRATDQRAAGECELRHGLPAAFIDRPRAIGHAGASFEIFADRGVLLPALKLLIG